MSYGITRVLCEDVSTECEDGPLYEITRSMSLSTVSGPYCYKHAARRCAQLNASASPQGRPGR